MTYHVLLFMPKPPAHYNKDIRFWIPISLQVKLIDAHLPYASNVHRNPIQHHQFGIYMRLRWIHCMFPQRGLYRSHQLKKIATSPIMSATTAVPSGIACGPEPDPHPWKTFWDDNTNLTPGIPSTQDVISNSEVPSESYERLLKLIDVLEVNITEFNIETDFFILKSENKTHREVNTAYIAAANLMKELHYKREPAGQYECAYIADNHHRCDVPVVIDTGCSFSVTPFVQDYVSSIEETDVPELTGITDVVKIHGVGWVEWPIRDIFGQIAIIRTQAYYVPTATIRLNSPQNYFNENRAGFCHFDHRKLIFATADGTELTFPFHP